MHWLHTMCVCASTLHLFPLWMQFPSIKSVNKCLKINLRLPVCAPTICISVHTWNLPFDEISPSSTSCSAVDDDFWKLNSNNHYFMCMWKCKYLLVSFFPAHPLPAPLKNGKICYCVSFPLSYTWIFCEKGRKYLCIM